MASSSSKRDPSDYDPRPHETRRQPRITPRPMKLSRPLIPKTITGNLQLPEHLARVIEDEVDIDEAPTTILPRWPSVQEIDDLKRTWLAMPTWDIEFSHGFTLVQNELAAWHDDQIMLKARQLGCSHLMASVLEELVRCWIHGVQPQSPLAARVLASYG